MSHFLAFLKKDIQLEIRSGAQLLPFIALSLILSTFLGLGVSSAIPDSLSRAALFHPLIWGIFLLSGSMTVLRVFEADRTAKLQRILSMHSRLSLAYFFAKLSFIFALCLLNHVLASFFLAALLAVPIVNWLSSFLLLSMVVTLAYSALCAFLGGLLLSYTHRYVLFPCVLLPLLFPLFFAVIEVSDSVSASTGVLGAGGWFSLLIGLTTVYLVVGVMLFESVVTE